MNSIPVALIQLCATSNVAANLAISERLTREAASAGARVILLPEAYAFIGPHAGKVDLLEEIPPMPGGSAPILHRFCRIARETGAEIVLGGHHERAPDPQKCYNTCVHIGEDGEVRACYRKIHLFDVALDDGTELKESTHTLPGDRVVVTETAFGALGLSICYDLRFSYLYQALVDGGAMAICVPSAFTASTGAAHWHALLRARAIESQCYILAPAQHGTHNGNRTSYGHSLVVDPWGEVIAELRGGDGVLLADIEPERVAAVRRQLPSLRHRVVLPLESAV